MTPSRIHPTTSAVPHTLARYVDNLVAQDWVLLMAKPDACLLYRPDGRVVYVSAGGAIAPVRVTRHLLAHIRQYHNLSQDQLAALLHLTTQTIRNKEKGRTRITPRDIAAIAMAIQYLNRKKA